MTIILVLDSNKSLIKYEKDFEKTKNLNLLLAVRKKDKDLKNKFDRKRTRDNEIASALSDLFDKHFSLIRT